MPREQDLERRGLRIYLRFLNLEILSISKTREKGGIRIYVGMEEEDKDQIKT